MTRSPSRARAESSHALDDGRDTGRVEVLRLVSGEDREGANMGRLKLTDGCDNKLRIVNAGGVVGRLGNDPGEKPGLLLVTHPRSEIARVCSSAWLSSVEFCGHRPPITRKSGRAIAPGERPHPSRKIGRGSDRREYTLPTLTVRNTKYELWELLTGRPATYGASVSFTNQPVAMLARSRVPAVLPMYMSIVTR